MTPLVLSAAGFTTQDLENSEKIAVIAEFAEEMQTKFQDKTIQTPEEMESLANNMLRDIFQRVYS